MSTNDVPGAKKQNRDVLAMGAWAEHDDGSLILVEAVEGGSVVYSIFDMATDPPVEYRDSMNEDGFKKQFTFNGKNEKWTWHDKTVFPWKRIMANFPSGEKASSGVAIISAAKRVAESLKLRAGKVQQRNNVSADQQKNVHDMIDGIANAVKKLVS